MATFDVEDVIRRASQDQKIALLSGSDFWHTHSLPEFNVPSIRLSDGPNGIRGTRFFAGVPAVCLPCGTAMAATWDKELIRRAGVLLGEESKGKGAHMWLGPTINIQRSPLGGRGFESFSEDPYLSGIIASQIIQGCQSTGVIATPKHFVCNDQEHERRAVDTLVTPRALREVYLRPFQIAARDSRPGGIMTSYNKINGEHVSHSRLFLQDIMRDEWKWDPLVVSDWFGTYSAEGAIKAGMDLEMPAPSRFRGPLLKFALQSRLLTDTDIDKRVRRVLQFVKEASQANVSADESFRDSPEDRALNRKLASTSAVLLKNNNEILPFPKSLKKIALIGSHVKTPIIHGGGSASLDPLYTVSLYDAVKSQVGDGAEVSYSVGAYAHKLLPVLSSLLRVPGTDKRGGRVRFYNEPFYRSKRELIAEETHWKAEFQLMDYNKNPRLNFELFYATFEADFYPDEGGMWEFASTCCGTAIVFLDDELIIDNATNQKIGGSFFGRGTAEVFARKQLNAGQQYRIRIEFGSYATSTIRAVGVVTFGGGGARLGACRIVDKEQAVVDAVELAKNSDYTVLCTGLNSDWESEGSDRSHMDLPPGIDNLISRVLEANPRTVIVTQSGTPVTAPWHALSNAWIHAWYGGNETGNGIADVLFGNVNPCGKLSLSWPEKLQDNPSYLNFGSVNGRVLYGEDIYVGWRYYEKIGRDALFPFGHGLSYSSFTLSDLSCTRSTAKLTVHNNSSTAGYCVVQVYIAAPNSPTARPTKELHGFTKVFVEAGKDTTTEITIDKYAGSFWDESDNCWKLEEGTYEVQVGLSSRDIVLHGEFKVDNAERWLGL